MHVGVRHSRPTWQTTVVTTSFLSASRLTREQTVGLPSFSASDKKKDPRYKWFVQNFGNRCWELDALDPERSARPR